MPTARNGISVFAPAKINLFLHVGERRADGYHALQSLVCFAEVGDQLAIFPSDELTLLVHGEFSAALPSSDSNLVLRAARAYAAVTGVAAAAGFELSKNLPVASGVGGGSADAAAVLRGLHSIWRLSGEDDEALSGQWPFANREDILKVASSLGADVPVCLLSSTAWMEGRGDRVLPLAELPKVPLVLANPGIKVSTVDVFRRLQRRTGVRQAIPSGLGRSVGDLVDYLTTMRNDLEKPALSLAPSIGNVLEDLVEHGASLARMSGSGATCFGLFETEVESSRAANAIANKHPDWWVRATRVAPRTAGFPRPLLQ